MRKLLVAVDGSDQANRALDHAIELVADEPASMLHLVTVQAPILTFPEIGIYLPADQLVAAERAAGTRILAMAAERAGEAGARHVEEILVGPPGPTIAGRADALACDGIVMGTRGMGAIGNLLLGSVATRVVHHAKVPVTLVP